MGTLHKDVLEALGFHTVTNHAGTHWLEDDNGKMYKDGSRYSSPSASACRTEADAWAQAPTLDALMPKLVEAVSRIGAILTETVSDIPMVQVSLMMPTPLNGRIVWDYGDYQGVAATYLEAVASVFVQMCAEGLIDGKAVVL